MVVLVGRSWAAASEPKADERRTVTADLKNSLGTGTSWHKQRRPGDLRVFGISDGGHSYHYVGQWGQSCGAVENPSIPNTCPGETFGSVGGGHPHCVVLGNDGLVYVCNRPRMMEFDRPLGMGGRRPIGYFVQSVSPGGSIRFRFTSP